MEGVKINSDPFMGKTFYILDSSNHFEAGKKAQKIQNIYSDSFSNLLYYLFKFSVKLKFKRIDLLTAAKWSLER